jgi:hypothetical protein
MDPSVLPTVDLSDDQELINVVVPMQRGGVISGRVLDPSGRPMLNIGVTALLKRLDVAGLPSAPSADRTPMLMPFGQGDANEQGEFRIE